MQNEGHRIEGAAVMVRVVRDEEALPGIVEGPDQPRDHGPLRAVRIVRAPATHLPAECEQCGMFGGRERRCAVIAGEIDGPVPSHRTGRGPVSGYPQRRGGHGLPSCRAAASCCTRQAWIWAMPWFNFAANSRPDRWMYCSVVLR